MKLPKTRGKKKKTKQTNLCTNTVNSDFLIIDVNMVKKINVIQKILPESIERNQMKNLKLKTTVI